MGSHDSHHQHQLSGALPFEPLKLDILKLLQLVLAEIDEECACKTEMGTGHQSFWLGPQQAVEPECTNILN